MELNRALLGVSEAMFEAVGVLQRDAPLTAAKGGQAARQEQEEKGEAYRQLLGKYSLLLNERIAAALEQIEAVQETGDTLAARASAVQARLPQYVLARREQLKARLDENTRKHVLLTGLFDELVQNGRYY